MYGTRRRVGHSFVSRLFGPQVSHHDDASDGYSSAGSASDLNEETPNDFETYGRAMRDHRGGHIQAGMRALSRTILGSRHRPSMSDNGESSCLEDTGGESGSDSSSYTTGHDDSDSEDMLPGRGMSHATTTGLRRRRRDAFCSNDITPHRRETRLYDQRQDTSFFSNDEDTHEHLNSEDVSSSEEDQAHRLASRARVLGRGREPYIPTPEDFPSRSGCHDSAYQSSNDSGDDDDVEDVSPGSSEAVGVARDFDRYGGVGVYPSRRRRH